MSKLECLFGHHRYSKRGKGKHPKEYWCHTCRRSCFSDWGKGGLKRIDDYDENGYRIRCYVPPSPFDNGSTSWFTHDKTGRVICEKRSNGSEYWFVWQGKKIIGVYAQKPRGWVKGEIKNE